MAEDSELRRLLTELQEVCDPPLSPAERILLTTDGTVTRALESLALAPVDVDIVRREVENSTLYRCVTLEPESSRPAITAKTEVDLDAVGGALERKLLSDHRGLGRLLYEGEFETRRDIREIDYQKEAPRFASESRGPYLTRWYTISLDGEEFTSITEYFSRPELRDLCTRSRTQGQK
ncbi:chorismate--pyruvate lyase family protein [Halomicrobium salinisoli]|uniref:chorismate--pyruvate lyase family protein n=1 Tax=Halomicrobium salinisoli TaxID=2878391 RepID=UPI001CEFE089|nr:chorismate pyruvate-lyase family protein [Halomicrobium salinisoli]